MSLVEPVGAGLAPAGDLSSELMASGEGKPRPYAGTVQSRT